MNADGKQDLVYSSLTSSTLSIRLGNGDGTFAPSLSIATAGTAAGTALSDFNGDGRLDIAVCTGLLSVVSAGGQGYTSLAYLPRASVRSGLERAAAGDLNGDGRPDLVLAANGVYVALNSPGPSVVVSDPVGAASGNVAFSYQLRSADEGLCSVFAEYSTDGGQTWHPAMAAEGTVTEGLISSVDGEPHTFVWASATDLPGIDRKGVRFRLAPAQTYPGAIGTTGEFDVANIINRAPTEIQLSSHALAENAGPTMVGWFGTIDPNAADRFSYALTSGQAFFEIRNGNELWARSSFDYETATSHGLTVQVVDAGGLSLERSFTVAVTDEVNVVVASYDRVEECRPPGEFVGALGVAETTGPESFTFSLVDGEGSDDNGNFAIDDCLLRTRAVLDFEAKASHTIRVRAQGSLGSRSETVLIIYVDNVNEGPEVELSPGAVAENSPAGTVAGSLLVIDPEGPEGALLELVPGDGDTDNSMFSIVGDELRTTASFDHETKSAYSVRVRVTDTGYLWSEKIFTINVTNVNEPPRVVAIFRTIYEDAACAIGTYIPGEFFDPDGDDLHSVKVLSLPAHGILRLKGIAVTSGQVIPAADIDSLVYTPDADFAGNDSFQWNASDGELFDEWWSSVSFTIIPVNDAPRPLGASLTTDEDTAAGGEVTATDVDSPTLVYRVATAPAHGTVVLTADGSFTYTPAADYTGPDEFTFKANDGRVDSAAAAVNIVVTAVNDAPVAISQTFTTFQDTTGTGKVTATDVDNATLVYSLVTAPSFGTLVLNADGSFTYSPPTGYQGPDSFTFFASDGQLASNVATVNITVAPPNHPPIAADLALTTDEDTAKSGTVTATDLDGATLVYSVVTPPAYGNLVLSIDGSFTYTPVADYHGPDSFTFKANDGTIDSNSATVTIQVVAREDAPRDLNLSNSTIAENLPAGSTVGELSGTDADGDWLTFSLPPGLNDNSLFRIVGAQLRTSMMCNFEVKSAYSVTVRMSDGDLYTDKLFAINVLDVEEVPTPWEILGTEGADTVGLVQIGQQYRLVLNGETTYRIVDLVSSITINLLAGDDSITIGGTTSVTISGGEGNDTLKGGEGADSISGGAGNDSIIGMGGNDTITGDAGDDTVYSGMAQIRPTWGMATMSPARVGMTMLRSVAPAGTSSSATTATICSTAMPMTTPSMAATATTASTATAAWIASSAPAATISCEAATIATSSWAAMTTTTSPATLATTRSRVAWATTRSLAAREPILCSAKAAMTGSTRRTTAPATSSAATPAPTTFVVTHPTWYWTR